MHFRPYAGPGHLLAAQINYIVNTYPSNYYFLVSGVIGRAKLEAGDKLRVFIIMANFGC